MSDALGQIRALLETPSHRLLDDGRPHITAGVPRMDNCRLCEALALLDGAVLLTRRQAGHLLMLSRSADPFELKCQTCQGTLALLSGESASGPGAK